MKLSIIANPAAGGGRPYRALRHYISRWNHADWEVEILTTQSPDHAGVLARELIRQPPDLLAICGGDGTVNEVASCIPAPPFPIAIIPAGTANVLARELGLPLDPVKAINVALERKVRRVDLGELGPDARRKFLFVAGIGFDAYAVFRVWPKLKKTLGIAAYVAASADCLLNYSFPEFRVTADGENFRATSCLVCNAKSYGGGLTFCPNADMADGLLDLLILQGRRRLALAWFLLLAWFGKPETGDWIHRLRAKTVRIEGPGEVLIQADGELAGTLPLNASLINATFPLVIP